MPSRRDFDVIEFKQWMGNLGVLDVIDGGADFYYRLLGTKIVALYGYELTGKYVSVLPEVVRDAVLKEYRHLIECRAPVCIERRHVIPARHYTRVIKLLLPLSSDGEAIDQILTCSYPVK
tara:strand:+ start:1427 stop:1786 length:360 start_codon:yes stop_codon:yes gene_type:complete